ncbi:hypothetical protein OIU84_001020 [Salix udensis]|uniref:Leucine-rich repeat-containing N-terminal plant-type domain-containing protein n=1 Tax=Salix udensis TaxID=889485 RepID=A0AAD6PN24_9ROSI|nr:hypothetical protein OIU84_001020 [Salix udensis]
MADPLLSLFLLCLLLSTTTTTTADDAGTILKLASALTPTPKGWSKTNSNGYCNWNGVNCDNSNNVISINLASEGLSGTLPSELSTLSYLQSLSLQGNKLSGPLPSFANIASLKELYIGSNNFTSIPIDFFKGLTSLQTLSMNDNINLDSWAISTDLTESSSLITFEASQANIIGTIPDMFASFASLQNLRLSYNNLTGGLPPSFANSGIQNLWLNNQEMGLSGTIEVLPSMEQLSQVWLHKNQFTGPIPDLSKCKSLFDLQLRDNQFTGIFPDSLSSLPSLLNISFYNNKLQGPVPQFGKNVKVDTSGLNNFCLDTAGVACDPQVTTLLEIAGGFGYPVMLSDSWKGNDACSGWPFVTCDSQKKTVITVSLGKQHFGGIISPAFTNLTALTTLKLNDNNLSGPIPDSLLKLSQLSLLDISNNNLTGKIPAFTPSVKLITTPGNPLLGSGGGSGSGGTPSSGSDTNTTAPGGGTNETGNGSKKGSPGLIAGVVVGIVIICAIGFFVLFKVNRKKKRGKSGRVNDQENGNAINGLVKNGSSCCTNGYGVLSEIQSQSSGNHSGRHFFEGGNIVISIEVLRLVTDNFSENNILATGRVTTKVDVYAFGVILMEVMTGRKALDDTVPDERAHLVTWFRRVLVNKDNLPKAIDQTLNPDEETFVSIFKVAELAGHCTAREPHQRPDMGHAVNVLGPLVEQWKPTNHEEEGDSGIDLHMSLPQFLQRWQADEGLDVSCFVDYDVLTPPLGASFDELDVSWMTATDNIPTFHAFTLYAG